MAVLGISGAGPKTGLRLGGAYLLYWTVGAILVGMLAGPFVLPAGMADHSGHLTHDHAAAHGEIELAAGDAPRIALTVTRDAMAGWNLHAEVTNFTFAPLAVNETAGEALEGHAHIYVDGEKVARLYGAHYHLSNLEPGDHVVRVTLNTNDHDTFVMDGVPVAAEVTVTE